MPDNLFPTLDRLIESEDPGKSLSFLIDEFLAAKEYGLVFEARLMKKRLDLGLPLVQTDPIDTPEYQQSVIEAAREAGNLFLSAGNIERAWPYFRAISETEPVAQAIGRIEPREGLEGIIAIAFQEGVHPLKGLELILAQHGMCRAITAFGMQAVSRDRDRCIALLVTSLHAEVVARISRAIEAQEGSWPVSASLVELMAGREWLFGEWDYYVDTSHLLSILPYSVEVTDPEILRLCAELCEYGKHLSERFRSPGIPPFEDQYVAYGHYVQALLGNSVDEHLEYFRKQVAESDPEVAGDAPGRTLVRLLISLGRHKEALNAVVDHVFEDAPYGVPVPSALQLCYRAGEYARLRELARERGDLLSYAAGGILNSKAKQEARSA